MTAQFERSTPVHNKLIRLGEMLRQLKRQAALLLIAAGLTAGVPSAGHAQITVDRFGEWEIQCDVPAGARFEQCALVGGGISEQEPYGVFVYVLKTADREAQLFRVQVPLGILLTAQLGLLIDGERYGWVDFVRCREEGCWAEVILDEDLLTALRNGEIATFVMYESPDIGFGIEVPLDGFAEGFDALP